MGIVLWICAVLLGGCASQTAVDKQPWSVAAAAHLRAQLDRDREVVAVDEGLLTRFYLKRDDRPAWCGPTGPKSQADALLLMLQQAADDGLTPADYALGRIEAELARWRRAGAKPGLAAMMRFDALLTRAFLAYGGHLQRGRVDPRAIHPQWQAPFPKADMAGLLQTALDLGQVAEALAGLRPPQRGYRALRQALQDYRGIAALGGWPAVEQGGGEPLVARLRAEGDLATVEGAAVDLSAGIARFQERHGLEPTGALNEVTLAELNIPVAVRVAAIALNMERWRWLPHDPGTRYILVRIADFELDAVAAGETVLNMRVIVGKPYWRTPVFSARLTHLVFNPFWYIPRSIAVADILPIVRRDPGYFARRNVVVTQGSGVQQARVDPDTVDWAGQTAVNFAYAFTQAPGADNPLGKIKFHFPNPYHVYLHDTPHDELFNERVRAFSHGCIRLERPLDLAAFALAQEGNWPRVRIASAVASNNNREVSLIRPLPVYLLYWTTWVDEQERIQFRRDDYDADAKLLQLVGSQGRGWHYAKP